MAYGFVRWFGAKWIDQRFASQLEASRQAHATEIEHLRSDLAAIRERSTRLTQREFDSLSAIWDAATDAYLHANTLTAMLRSYSNVADLSDEELIEFLDQGPLTATQKTSVKAQDKHNRQDFYINALTPHESHRAKLAVQAFSDTVQKEGIYLNRSLYNAFDEFSTLIHQAVSTWSLHREMRMSGDGRL